MGCFFVAQHGLVAISRPLLSLALSPIHPLWSHTVRFSACAGLARMSETEPQEHVTTEPKLLKYEEVTRLPRRNTRHGLSTHHSIAEGCKRKTISTRVDFAA